MITQRHCPYCKAAARDKCQHLAVAIEGRYFVQRCIELCQGEKQWEALCAARKERREAGSWSSEQEDFMWLETAFCNGFLRRLRWFGGMDHEWRTGASAEQGGFFVILWSRNPQRLWWELRDEFARQTEEFNRTRVATQTAVFWPPAPPTSYPSQSAQAPI